VRQSSTRYKAYELARHERFPCRVLQVGRRYVVPTAELGRTLGITMLDHPSAEVPHPVDG
jgi:hypothetical protein